MNSASILTVYESDRYQKSIRGDLSGSRPGSLSRESKLFYLPGDLSGSLSRPGSLSRESKLGARPSGKVILSIDVYY